MAPLCCLFVFLLSLYTSYVSGESNESCTRNAQQCNTERYCQAQTAKVTFPDPLTLFQTDQLYRQSGYGCVNTTWCDFFSLSNIPCLQMYVPDYDMAASMWYNEQCATLTLPITINVTLSCCQPDLFNCTHAFKNIHKKEDNSFIDASCSTNDDITNELMGLVECYATEEFMRYVKCNVSNFDGKCPLYWWNNLQTYAKCACANLGESPYSPDAWKYFNELTALIESIFAQFLMTTEECPKWAFTCNDKGDAQLDVFEIICPLIVYDDTDFDELKQEVDEGVKSLTSDQVEIFVDVIRVLMYSEEEAINALNWLMLNTTDTTPDEIGSPCNMEETKWNLNEIYGDYIPPELATPAPTDVALKQKINIFMVILLILLCCISI